MTSPAELSVMPLPAPQSELGTGPGGLSAAEAATRLHAYGANEIAEQVQRPACGVVDKLVDDLRAQVEGEHQGPARSSRIR